ncbi:hypothetical protein IF188_08290 [Microbacterium sp. NEAU-LLC]|uniref:Uncharacterized protein n=1 Tax=Microbacterium helvum TaxID=2773713 RepID=A0ABR8NQ49_9MICO|nr:hypothetical protein [Microbacterium helvum]MBD3941691.1 hypothetical protein [Microbacterium helvum]
MTALNRAAARTGATKRHYGANDPRTIAARQDLAALRIEEAVDRALAGAPPLRDEQVERLTATLRRAAV